MGFTSPLFLVWLFFKVVQNEASSWTITMPSLVKGLPGSCVVIPCSFNYPDPQKTPSKFTGIWSEVSDHVIYHPNESKIMEKYRNRTKLLGDVTQKNCSLKIDPLQPDDHGPFYFRIEIADYNNYSYKEKIVYISNKPDMDLSLEKEVVEGQLVVASCSVSYSCPIFPPVFDWSHSGEVHFNSQQLNDGQWKAIATLTFHPSYTDHNKPLLCIIKYKGGEQETSKVLKVKYAPVNVKVEYKSDVKEGEDVQLNCSSDSHPPANSYEWYNENGAQLHRGKFYILPNVSRHMNALYCTANNTQGRGKSSPVQLSVLYAPEINSLSSCSSEWGTLKCVCIIQSEPPCTLHFGLSDRVLSGTTVERHGSVTIGTLQGEFVSSEFIQCLANNSEGSTNRTLSLPVDGKMQNLYIAIIIGTVVVLVIILLAVGFVKKCRGVNGDTPAQHSGTMVAGGNGELCRYTEAKRKEMDCGRITNPEYYDSDQVYDNIEIDSDEADYVNVIHH